MTHHKTISEQAWTRIADTIWRLILWGTILIGGGGSACTPLTADSAQDTDMTVQSDAAMRPAPIHDLAAAVISLPTASGPWQIAERDDRIKVAATADTVNIHCAYPTTGPSSGPYPVVVFGHGLQLPVNQYFSYLRRLATFGYVALTVDFPATVFNVNNPNQAKDLLAGVDWAVATLPGQVDSQRVGTSGHSLGGKVALLAATMDARVQAAFVLDPVDGGGPSGCKAPNCVQVKTLLPDLHIPTGFLGETIDAKGAMPCAPAAENFLTLYAVTNSPSLGITALGANHLSFLDDQKGCGLVCNFCQKATVPDAQVADLAHALLVAFFQRYLRGQTGYDTYLTGEQAQLLWVATGQAVIASK